MKGAGPLRHFVAIQRPIETRSEESNDVQLSWLTFAEVWAALDPVSGSELWREQQVQPEATHKVTIHYLQGLSARMRIVYGSRTFQILEIRDLREQNRRMELVTKELS